MKSVNGLITMYDLDLSFLDDLSELRREVEVKWQLSLEREVLRTTVAKILLERATSAGNKRDLYAKVSSISTDIESLHLRAAASQRVEKM
jgi:hypothetical protein